MTISDNGVRFITQFEGFRANPYRDSTGLPTIGYGTIHYEDGSTVKMTDPAITSSRAMDLLKRHIIAHISPYLDNTFTRVNQAQYDALCSFCYNLGTGALDKSSLKHAIFNNAQAQEITDDFDKWDMAAGHVMAGLLNRRQHEAKLFLTGQYN